MADRFFERDHGNGVWTITGYRNEILDPANGLATFIGSHANLKVVNTIFLTPTKRPEGPNVFEEEKADIYVLMIVTEQR